MQTVNSLEESEKACFFSGECCFCGEIMIRDIDTPFIEDQQFDQVINDWL
jgi:hypothetical protein